MFDLEVILKNGLVHTFVGIDKKELQLIIDFFQTKKITVKMTEDPAAKLGISDDEFEEDDRGVNTSTLNTD